MTFSIAARCPRTGALGVATSSKALGAGGLVPYIKAGVGAIASQSFVNPYLGYDGLRFLEDGLPAERALERLVESDQGRKLRQVGIVDKGGRVAAYTGERCIDWAGHVAGGGYLCLGNILVGEDVVKAMAQAFEYSLDDDVPERLMQALEAGQEAGGDRRGRQSAGLQVYTTEEYPIIDLRVDDHPDPVPELRRVFGVWMAEESDWLRMIPTREDFTPHWEEVVRLREMVEEDLLETASGNAGKES
ncbi:MAG TPA: DUF1028 domain-containing protein [Dehalococcoidia bacterium]|nr:DUF1028 domain-containing protein [Dehalococcoidia bacterium]